MDNKIELQNLLDKVFDAIYHHRDYHCTYCCGNIEEHDDYFSFEVYGYSDQGEGSEWTECWSIDAKGRIYSEDTTYENYEDFLKDWY